MDRIKYLHKLTRRLLALTAVSLAIFVAVFVPTLFYQSRLMISWLVFICGIIGGFVSIQQRVKHISDEELILLCDSWLQILLIPIFGAIFSLVLYCIFLGELLGGSLFPTFYFATPPATGPDTNFMLNVLMETYPSTGPDLAKLIFWSFTAGFAERLVPQIISKITSNATGGEVTPD